LEREPEAPLESIDRMNFPLTSCNTQVRVSHNGACLKMEDESQPSRSLRLIAAENVSAPRVVPTREGYDLWAQIYDDEDNPLIALETMQFRSLLGDVRGLAVADIGCGTGRHALAMAAAGATVIGVDFSMGMLVKAKAKPGAGTVHFVRHDVAMGLPFVSRAFDCVTCCLVLEHIGDLAGMLYEMARICRVGGFVCLSDLHPAMGLLGLQAQFTDPVTGRKTRPAGVKHQLSDYVMAATRAGLRIEHMSEHVVDEALAVRSPRARKYVGWPLLLLMRLRNSERRDRE
jgi:ubiquinone/menaquinone biosynthesis C-methylase UbiE